MRVLLCGYGHLGFALLKGLLESEHCEVVGVFRWSSRPGGYTFWDPVEASFKQLIDQHGIEDIICPSINGYEFTTVMQRLQPNVLLVGSWGEILKPHILEFPGVLAINCHPSKLPAHRGANPYASVVLQNETETGVTFHRMAARIDAGNILLQRSIPLGLTDTGESVRDKCMRTAYEMVPELLQGLKAHLMEASPLPELPQDEALQSYFPLLKAEDGAVLWESAHTEMERKFRALYPWVMSHSFLEGRYIVLFLDPRFCGLRPHTSKPPGTILYVRNGHLGIATSDPAQCLEVSKYRLEARYGYWPVWVSRLLAGFMMRPGKRFYSARISA